MLFRPVTTMTKKAAQMARTSWLVTLGAVALTRRETLDMLERLEERGEEMTRRQPTPVYPRETQPEAGWAPAEVEIELRPEQLVEDLNLGTKGQMRSVERKVDVLNTRLETAIETAEQEAQRRAEAERREAERKARAERREAERKEAERKAEAERRAAERKAAAERREAERQEAERKAEAERRAAERKAAAERREAERQEAERKAEAERRAAERKAEAERLPFRGYDELRVPDILERLPDLSEEELEQVRRYEQAHAAHKGVLDAVQEQLDKRQPLPEYRNLSAAQIMDQVAELDVDQVLKVREYEAAHANRVTVIRAADRRLADEIGMADYVGRNVRDVVEGLPELNDEALAKVRRFEEQHENRQGVLRAIDRLASDRMPLPNYGGMTVDEIAAQLEGLDAERLQAVRAYEETHSNRVTVMRAVDKRLETLNQPEAQPEAQAEAQPEGEQNQG